MFHRQALRASRTVRLASAGAVGAVVLETTSSEEPSQPLAVVGESPAETSEVLTDVVVVEPEPPKKFLLDLPEKLSIYPKPTPTLVLLDTPSPLELQIGQVRRELCGYYSGARTQVQGVVDQWIHIEKSIESRVKSFRDPTEALNPGLLYTGISALTASIIVRSRSLPIRFIFPPLSFLGAFAYFLPRTAGRVGDWVEDLEGKYVPRAGEIRRTSIAHSAMAWGMLGEKVREGKEGLGKGARAAVEGIESTTGLRLGEAMGWSKAAEDKKAGEEEKKA